MSQVSKSTVGDFASLSIESLSLKKSMDIYKIIGFTDISGSIEQGWISMTNTDGLSISLMPALTCPHLFFNPSLTFFNGSKNLEIIEKIRSLNIPITEEITHFNKDNIADNIIIRDPGGLGFFIFGD